MKREDIEKRKAASNLKRLKTEHQKYKRRGCDE